MRKAVSESVDGEVQAPGAEVPAKVKRRRKRKSRARDWSYRPLHRRMYTKEEIAEIEKLLAALGERAKKRRDASTLSSFREVRDRNVENYVGGIQGKLVKDTGFEPPHISMAHYFSHLLATAHPKTAVRTSLNRLRS